MHPLLQAALTSILRAALIFGAGYLVRAGIWTQNDAETYVTGAAIALLTVGWSLWKAKYSHALTLTALDMPKGSTYAQAQERVKAGDTPPLLTPVDVSPTKAKKEVEAEESKKGS